MSVLARNRKQLGVLAFLVVVLVLLRPFILRKLRGLLQLFGRRKLTHPIPKYNLREHSSEGAVRTIFRRQTQTHDTSLYSSAICCCCCCLQSKSKSRSYRRRRKTLSLLMHARNV